MSMFFHEKGQKMHFYNKKERKSDKKCVLFLYFRFYFSFSSPSM